jgi:hypothetical protein
MSSTDNSLSTSEQAGSVVDEPDPMSPEREIPQALNLASMDGICHAQEVNKVAEATNQNSPQPLELWFHQEQEFRGQLREASERLSNTTERESLVNHCSRALASFDAISVVIYVDNEDIKNLLSDTREELIDGYLAVLAGRSRMAFSMARGVMEGLFAALYYRQQSISLNLWASNKSFLMVHQMLDSKHEFHMYYKQLFEDDGFKTQYAAVTPKKVFEEAVELYDLLSCYVHKKSPSARSQLRVKFEDAIERVFRIALCFLEREENLPSPLCFPVPPTYAQWVMDGKLQVNKKTNKMVAHE